MKSTESIFKKAGLILIAAMISLFAVSCKSSSAQSIDWPELQASLLESDENFPEMKDVNSSSEDAGELFAYLSDMDYSKVDGFLLSYSSDGLADEIAVIRMKNQSDVTDMMASLQSHADSRVKLFDSYDPSQSSRAENAEIYQIDNYAVLIIADHADQVEKCLEEYLDQDS